MTRNHLSLFIEPIRLGSTDLIDPDNDKKVPSHYANCLFSSALHSSCSCFWQQSSSFIFNYRRPPLLLVPTTSNTPSTSCHPSASSYIISLKPPPQLHPIRPELVGIQVALKRIHTITPFHLSWRWRSILYPKLSKTVIFSKNYLRQPADLPNNYQQLPTIPNNPQQSITPP